MGFLLLPPIVRMLIFTKRSKGDNSKSLAIKYIQWEHLIVFLSSLVLNANIHVLSALAVCLMPEAIGHTQSLSWRIDCRFFMLDHNTSHKAGHGKAYPAVLAFDTQIPHLVF